MTDLQKVYETIWNKPEYRKSSPGLAVLPNFVSIANPQPTDSILDIGCGSGKASAELFRLGFTNVTPIDFAGNCLDEELSMLMKRFIQHDITKPFPVTAKFGYCVDVMEHLEPSQVDVVLKEIRYAVDYLYVRISTRPDTMGRLIGKSLHLTIEQHDWWEQKCIEHEYYVLDKSITAGEAVTFYLQSR